MADIRIKDLPADSAPLDTDVVAVDGATTRKSTLAEVIAAARPLANQAEAEAGTDPSKAMTPLTVKQAIDALGGTQFATTAQGAKADSALQPASIGVTVQAYNDMLSSVAGLSYSNGDLIYANGAASMARLAIAPNGYFLMSDGSVPVWSSSGPTGMLASVYDPQGISNDVFDRANHTGTQAIATVSGLQTALDAKAAQAGVVRLLTDYGVVEGSGADGVANATAYNATLDALEAAGGGAVFVLPGDYVIGDDAVTNTCIRARSNVTIIHYPGVRYINLALGRTSPASTDADSAPLAAQACLLQIDGKEFGSIDNFHWLGKPTIDGNGSMTVRRGINVFGETNNVTVEARGQDLRDAILIYGDLIAHRFSRGRGLNLSLDYEGTHQNAAYELCNLFPMGKNGARPGLADVRFYDCDMDGTNNTAKTTSPVPTDLTHAVNCIKLNNVDGVHFERTTLRGGTISCLNISNGTRNVTGEVNCSDSRVGAVFTNSWNNIAGAPTGNVHFHVNMTGGIAGNRAVAIRAQGAMPELDLSFNGSGFELYDSDYVRIISTGVTGTVTKGEVLTTSAGATAVVQGFSADFSEIILARPLGGSGTIPALGQTWTTAGGGAGTISEAPDPDALIGATIRGKSVGSFFSMRAPSFARSPCRNLTIDMDLDGRFEGALNNTAAQSISGSANWQIDDSRFNLRFTNPPIYPFSNFGDNNEIFVSSDGMAAAVNASSAVVRDYGENNQISVSVAAGQVLHTYIVRAESGSTGLRINRLTGPSALKLWAGTAAHPITRGTHVFRADFDLSGADVTQVLAVIDHPLFVTGLEIVYPDGTTSDTGVLLEVGRLSDTDQVFSLASLTSQAAGTVQTVGRMTTSSALYLNEDALTGGTLSARCAGSKVGADRAVMLVHAVYMMTP